MNAARIIKKADPLTVLRKGSFNYKDFCVADGQKADLINGVIYMASPEGTDVNELFVWLLRLLGHFVELRDLGKVFGTRVACRLDEDNAPEPDIVVVLKPHLHKIERGGIRGAADVAIEIVSPESAERDYEKKWKLYEQFRFPEYWIIDEQLRQVTLLRLDRRGKYREARPKNGVVRSVVVKGFWLRAEWLWLESRPRKTDALQTILGKEKQP